MRPVNDYWRFLAGSVAHGFFQCKNKLNPLNPEDHIVISGEPRGGTTWLSELLLKIDQSNVAWEPLRETVVRAYKRNLYSLIGPVPYTLPGNADDQKVADFFDDIFHARYFPRTMYNQPFGRLFSARKWIYKFCRANPLLPYLSSRYAFKVIYLIRHPLAVISSQFRHPSFDHLTFKHNFLKQKKQDNILARRFGSMIETIETREESFAVWWALSNILPYEAIAEGRANWITVSYERLLTHPQEELTRLFDYLEIPLPAKAFASFEKPSATTRNGSPILSGGNQLEGWKKKIDLSTSERIIRRIHAIGITAYTTELTPRYELLGYPTAG